MKIHVWLIFILIYISSKDMQENLNRMKSISQESEIDLWFLIQLKIIN